MLHRLLPFAIALSTVACGSPSPDRDSSAQPDDSTMEMDGDFPPDDAQLPPSDGSIPPDATNPPDVVVPNCQGTPLMSDGVLDLALHAAHVHGTVTLNGAALPTLSQSRGTLTFTETTTHAAASFDLRSSGALTYVLTLAPGHYDVSFASNALACPNGVSAMACNSGVVRGDVAITTDGVLDIDLRTVHVRGQVTQGGAALPSATSSRGTLQFALHDGGTGETRNFGLSGAASYELTLLAGDYDVRWAGNSALCTTSTPSAVPCNAGVVRRNVSLMSDGVLDVDLHATHVNGRVTLAGAALPTASQYRGAISFSLRDGGNTVLSHTLDASSAANYALTVLSGSYDVGFAGNESLCNGSVVSAIPCNSGVVRGNVALATDGVLDVDLHAAHVRGSVLLASAPLPSSSQSRGAVSFNLHGGGSLTTHSLNATGAATYDTTLLAGTYDVRWDGNSALCELSGNAIPCNAGVVRGDVALMSDGVLDVDLHAAHVRGAVTLAGATLPSSSQSRGGLSFAMEHGGTLNLRPFTATGPASYDVTLLAGRYDIAWNGAAALCQSSGNVIPCNSGTIRSGSSLTADGVLDLDLRAAHVRGQVTLDGAQLPTSTQNRGSLVFALNGGGAGSPRELGASGAATYDIALLSGNYVVLHDANAVLCTGTGTAPALPCNDQVLAGCSH